MGKDSEKAASGGVSRKKIIIIAVIIVFALLCSAAAWGAVTINGIDTILPGVSVDGVSVGGLSVEEAAARLDTEGFATSAASVTVNLPYDISIALTAEEAGTKISSAQAASQAHEFGRDGGFYGKLKAYFEKTDINPAESVVADSGYIKDTVQTAVQQLEVLSAENQYTVGDEYIRVIKGVSAVTVNTEELCQQVSDSFINGVGDVVLDWTDKGEKINYLTMDSLYSAVCTAESGVKFNLEEAQSRWDAAQDGEEVVIDIYNEALFYRDVLGEKTTSFAVDSSRNNNISKAAAAINGVVLQPGESFSFNGTVGQRTEANGYLPAGAYSNGQVVKEVGGGICQVSSTLYYCTLKANLEITARSNHYFAVNYMPWGLDATVSWTSPDLKFVNNRTYPIKIEANANLNKCTLTVKIYGTDLDGSYVDIKTETWKNTDTFGATSYRNVYSADGTLISSKKEASSTYHYHTED